VTRNRLVVEPAHGGDEVTDDAAGGVTDGSIGEPIPDLLTGMATTRSIRRLALDPIPDDDLATILWHATRAPSGTNRQPVRYVVLRDDDSSRSAKSVLGRGFREGWAAKSSSAGYDRGSALDPNSRKGRQRAAMEYFVEHFEQFPVVVLVCLVRYREANPFEGASVYPACQNLLLAARALGYGGVLTGWHRTVDAELHDVLGIPDGVAIHATIPLGRPLGSHGPVRRLPLGDVVFDGSWDESAAWAVDPPGTRFAGPP
jgi:nitroreductase